MAKGRGRWRVEDAGSGEEDDGMKVGSWWVWEAETDRAC